MLPGGLEAGGVLRLLKEALCACQLRAARSGRGGRPPHAQPAALACGSLRLSATLPPGLICVCTLATALSCPRPLAWPPPATATVSKTCPPTLPPLGLRCARFDIILRNVEAESASAVAAAAEGLRASGFINYFGLQRFGSGAVPTHRWGWARWVRSTDGNFKCMLLARALVTAAGQPAPSLSWDSGLDWERLCTRCAPLLHAAAGWGRRCCRASGPRRCGCC